MKTNKAGEAISGHFLRAILPSVNEQFQRILLPLPFLIIKFRKICMSVLFLCVDINVLDSDKIENQSIIQKSINPIDDIH